MRILALFISAAMALVAGSAYGQTCRPAFASTPYSPSATHAPTYYQTPVVHTPAKRVVVEVVKEVPVAYPVLVPAFQFQYSPPYYAPVVPQAGYAPAPVAATPAGYGPAPAPAAPVTTPSAPAPGGNMYGAPGQQDKIKELAAALLAEMRRQAEADVNGDGPPAVFDPSAPASKAPAPKTPAPTGPAPAPAGPTPPAGGQTKEQAQPLALNAISRACAQCHTGQGAKGEVVIFNQPGVFNPGAPLKSMRREIDAGRMPPPSYNYRLTPAELETLRIWLPAAKE